MKKLFLVIGLCFLLVSSFSCRKRVKAAALNNPYAGKAVYTRVNLRYDPMRNTGSYIGYRQISLLPVNSKVRIVSLKSRGFVLEVSSGKHITVAYRKLWGGKPVNEILPLLFSESALSAKLSQFNKTDMKGITAGKALVGMSKKAVIVALGYPPAHKTPSTDLDDWTYWQNRFITYRVNFENNKVVAVGKPGQ